MVFVLNKISKLQITSLLKQKNDFKPWHRQKRVFLRWLVDRESSAANFALYLFIVVSLKTSLFPSFLSMQQYLHTIMTMMIFPPQLPMKALLHLYGTLRNICLNIELLRNGEIHS